MTDLKKIEKIIENNRTTLREKFNVKSIGVFGSYSKRSHTRESDIDILVEFNGPVGWKFFGLKDYLEKILGKKVDLATKNSLREEMKQNILDDVVYI